MALTGQLSDMSLAELIEFFCNQRKTGRLKIDYQRGHSVFFIKDGELVDAKVGILSGDEAVYFSLTLPNAAFDFSPEVLPTRRTINQTWTQVVLEGLRRLDEGISPSEADAFGAWTPSEADVSHMFEQVDRLGESESANEVNVPDGGVSPSSDEVPLSMMVDGASGGGSGAGKRKWLVMGVAASVALVCAVAAIPLSGRFAGKSAASASSTAAGASQPSAALPAAPAAGEVAPDNPSPESSAAAPADPSADASAAATEEARRVREARERRERERKAEERAKKDDAADSLAAKSASPTPAAAAPSGPKSVRVTVSYDEAGRVTQASVAGSTPGAEAYGGTAVRVARGRRFPAGKAGSTVVTIPVN